jgi:hypothetical protein
MSDRPGHEPSRTFADPRRLWDDPNSHPQSLGCRSCPDFDLCGGLHSDAGIIDCSNLCSCRDKSSCDMVCRSNPGAFVRRMREVKGLEFETVERADSVAIPKLPRVIPLIDHKYRRASTFPKTAVALPFWEVVKLSQGGGLHVHSRAELAARFRISEHADIVLSGTGKDSLIENWWGNLNRKQVLQKLRKLGIALITTPNYSVLTDVPRTDNLHAMKRILIVWREMTVAGIPTALHVNARTERDYARWTELIRARSEIRVLAFEFGTGAGRRGRIDVHVAYLCKLAREVGRPIDLIVRGGGQKLGELRRHFRHVTLIETDSFTWTHRRQAAYFDDDGSLMRRSVPTLASAPLDDLFERNADIVEIRYEKEANLPPLSGALPRRVRRTHPDGNNKPLQMSFLGDLETASQARPVSLKD